MLLRNGTMTGPMQTMKRIKGRTTRGEVSPDQSQTTTHLFRTNLFSTGRFPALCLLSFLPAFFLFSCAKEMAESGGEGQDEIITFLDTRTPLSDAVSSLHVFVYNDDSLGRLDSYQRFDTRDSGRRQCTSRSGRKLFAAIANLDISAAEWTEISSFESLQKLVSEFRDEDPQQPVMTSVTRATAGGTLPVPVNLERILSNVRIKSICCDFKGREYEGAVITNARAYLININGRCELFRQEDFHPAEMVNYHGEEAFPHPEMIEANIGNIGNTALSPGISLYCYPNDGTEDTAALPSTRLVIEGEINGVKYYWPVNISPQRNLRYDYEFLITRTGTDSPDIPAETGSIHAVCNVLPWNEKDEQVVTFRIKGGKMREMTKSSDPDENLISDLNLFIFNTDDQMEEWRYLKGSALSRNGDGIGLALTLLKNASYSVYAVANTGYPLRGISRKDDLLSYRYYLAYPDELRTGIPMSGYLEDFKPEDSAEMEIGLSRMMAKVSLKMDRTELDPGVRVLVRSVQAGGCPNSARLFGNSKAETARGVFPAGYVKSWGQLDALNNDSSLGVSSEASLYMLENMQGDLLSGISSQEEKVFPEGDLHTKVCSYLELKMEYYSSKKNTKTGQYLIYRFFLGEGPGNFDVRRNCHYHFTVKLSGDGLSGTGWRVDKTALE